jgi:hypothetical protein
MEVNANKSEVNVFYVPNIRFLGGGIQKGEIGKEQRTQGFLAVSLPDAEPT